MAVGSYWRVQRFEMGLFSSPRGPAYAALLTTFGMGALTVCHCQIVHIPAIRRFGYGQDYRKESAATVTNRPTAQARCVQPATEREAELESEPEAEPEPEPNLESPQCESFSPEPVQLEPLNCEQPDIGSAQQASTAEPHNHWPFALHELPPDVLGAVLGHLPNICLARCVRVSRAMLQVQVAADRVLWRPRVTKLLQSPEMHVPPGGVASWRHVMSIVPREFAAGRVEMVPVRSGTFLAGEQPVERTIDYSYWIDVHPVSCARFAEFAAAHRWRASRGDRATVKAIADAGRTTPRKPVAMVSWHEAAAFATWAGTRLPTCAEWEKAARGIEGQVFPWGNSSLPFDPGGSLKRTIKESVSPFGLRKLGMVFEWCEHDEALESGCLEGVNSDDEADVEFGYDVTATDVDGGGLGRGGWDGTGSGGLHGIPSGDFVPWSAQMKPNRGGSFRRHDAASFATYTTEYDNPEVKQDDLGFRCCFSFTRDGTSPPASRQEPGSSSGLFLAFQGEDQNFNPTFG